MPHSSINHEIREHFAILDTRSNAFHNEMRHWASDIGGDAVVGGLGQGKVAATAWTSRLPKASDSAETDQRHDRDLLATRVFGVLVDA